jgi:glycosyltransferase involved in cell wall biosynthesis
LKHEAIIPITVAIPVKNEAAALPACLTPLKRFAEVIVIDSGSTDATADVARSLGARVAEFHWNGRYPKKRNWLLLNEPPSQPWVLFLDADEIIDDAFCDAVAQAISRNDAEGYWLSYRNYFLGRPLRHGVAQRKLALFKVGAALYERIDEDAWSSFDMEIHEHPIVKGRVGAISVPIEHRDDRGLAHFLKKHVEYAAWEAQRLAALRGSPDSWSALTARQRFKYKNLTKWWYPLFYFLFAYVVKQGFRDGSVGLYYALYKAWYFHSIRLLAKQSF